MTDTPMRERLAQAIGVREVEYAAAEREKRKYRRTPGVPYAI